jgi:CelD/BcsL family acetyltransferase involved in cellulose biosynthesis
VERRAFRRAVIVEVADACRFKTMRAAWDDLAARACEPNPFMDPDVIAAAAAGDDANRAPVLLAWRGDRLVGVWAFSAASPESGLPITVLATPVGGMLPNGTPVIDRDHVELVLAAMLDAIVRTRGLPKLISVDLLNEGPVMAALQRVLAGRGCPPVILWRGVRPMLDGKSDPEAYFAHTMSGGRRRKLRQLRRRLSSRGELRLNVYRDRNSAGEAIERFIKLEASGWKAKSGASEFERLRYRDFVRTAVVTLADHGGVEIWELSLASVAISMALILRHLSGAYDWKIAYDERQRDCSPGVLLAQDYTTAFLTDPNVAFADSCAADDAGVLGTLWKGRQPIVNLIADARAGGSLFFSLWARYEIACRRLRDRARDARQAIWKTWPRRSGPPHSEG